jgi:hypothetical protein
MSVNSPITAAARWTQGEDKRLEWTVVDAAGAPVNCTAFTFLFELFPSQFSGSKLLSRNTVTLFNVNGTNDGVRVQIADTDTIDQATGAELIPAGAYWYEFWKTNEGDEQLLASGSAELQASRRRQEVA